MRGPNHCYISVPDELTEDEQLQALDEDLSSKLDDTNDADIMRCNPPCRTLDNYTIFDANQKQRIVSWELIGEDKRDVRFVGEVKAILVNHYEEDDEQELNSEDEYGIRGFEEKKTTTTRVRMTQRLRSNAIFSWLEEITQDGREIWLLTQYGWYKLQTPSEEMAPLVLPVLRQLNLASIVTSTLENNPLIAWKEFLESIKSCSSVFSYSGAEYKYTAEDIKKYANLLNNDIEAWLEFCPESGIPVHDELLESPLLKKIQYLIGNGKAAAFGNKHVSHRTVRRPVLKKSEENPTTLTPRINDITAGLYAKVSVPTESVKQGDAIKEINSAGLPANLESSIWRCGDTTRRAKWIGEAL